ncbi:MAG: T9SS type A sorting domain-containing protein [Bacteroidales bacterium]|nr:T9SS type A sorting domain-containing protein [Bacteroidales bacterium]
MKIRWIKLLPVLLLIGFTSNLYAQISINASGKDISGGTGSVSFSVGQCVYHTHAGINGSVAEGVQQPYEISVINAIDEAKGITLSVLAYPNPSTEYLTLEVKEFELSNLHFQLYEMQGKLLQSEKITSNQTSIAMSNLAPATYFVKVIQNNKEVKTFKIIKK